MTTFTTVTTEDKEVFIQKGWEYWTSYDKPQYPRQLEIVFFWPLTEQMELDLK
jgi:hypothetical protein